MFTCLHAAVGCHQLVLQLWAPQPQPAEVVQQVLVDHGELTTQHTTHIDVGTAAIQKEEETKSAGTYKH